MCCVRVYNWLAEQATPADAGRHGESVPEVVGGLLRQGVPKARACVPQPCACVLEAREGVIQARVVR